MLFYGVHKLLFTFSKNKSENIRRVVSFTYSNICACSEKEI